MLQWHEANDELQRLVDKFSLPIVDAIIAFASGQTQRSVARRLAVSFPKSNSYNAAAQRARTWLRTEDTTFHRMLRLLNEIPIGDRRQGLAYARARFLLRDGHEPSFRQGLALIRDVLKAHYKVDNKGLAKKLCEGPGSPDDREECILVLLEEFP